jgi:hypothetical protein
MALINCSIDSVSTVVTQGQGNITSQVLYISPDPGWVISATDFNVADRTYLQNLSSLVFTNGVNGVVLDAAIYSITLADTTVAGLADNKIKVTVDLTGYIMPGADTTLIIDIDGSGVDASLINLRAVLLEPDSVYTTTSISTNSTITHSETDASGVAGTHDRVYFNTVNSIESGVQIKLAEVTIQVNTGSYPNHQITPVSLAGVDGSFEGTDKFEILNVVETYYSDNLLQTYKFDLMFTDDVDLSNNPWASDYTTTGQYFPNVTTRLLFSTEEITRPVTGHVIDTVSTNFYTVDLDPSGFIIPDSGSLDDDKLTVVGDAGATFDVDIVETTIGGAFEHLDGFPASYTLPSGPGKTEVSIPVEFASVGSLAERTYSLTMTGTSGTIMGKHTEINGSRNNTNANNTVTNTFTQYKNPTIKVEGIKDSRTIWSTDKGPTVVTQIGVAKSSTENLSWRSDSKGNTSVNFTLESTATGTFVVSKQPVSFTSGDDNTSSSFTESVTDHGNVISIHSLVAREHTSSDHAEITGVIDFESYGTKDVTFTIDMQDIFTFTPA